MSYENRFSPMELRARRRLQWMHYNRRNRDKINAKKRDLNKTHPEVQREYSRRWNKRHREKRNEIARNWRRSRPGYYTEYWRKFYKDRPGYKRSFNLKRKAIKLAAYVPDSGVEELIRKWKSEPIFQCRYCEYYFPTFDLHIDHMTPLSRGGLHCPNNICRACPSCNLSKHDLTSDEFKKREGLRL